MTLPLALLCTVLLGQEAKEAAPSPSQTPNARYASQIRALNEGQDAQKRQAAKSLLATGDESVIPILMEALKQEDLSIRREIVPNLSKSFPKRAFDVFMELIRNGTPAQQYAGSHGLGYVKDPRVVPFLLDSFNTDVREVRQGVMSSMHQISVPLVDQLKRSVLGEDSRPSAAELALLQRFRELVPTRYATMTAQDFEDHAWFYKRLASHADAVALCQKYVESSSEAERPGAALIARMTTATRHWLGRRQRPQVKRLQCRFRLEELKSPEPRNRILDVDVSGEDLELLRYRYIFLERGAPLEFPVDGLVSYPQFCSPRVSKKDETSVEIRYQVPPMERLVAGIGTLGKLWWRGRLVTSDTAVLIVDTQRNVPLSEEVFDKEGRLLGTVLFEKYQQVAADAWAPLKVIVMLEERNTLRRRMLFEFRYQIAGNQVWFLSSASANELTEDEGPVECSHGFVEGLKIDG